jgi:hypothetical protein
LAARVEWMMKFFLGVGAALLVMLGIGWGWGAWGKSDVNHARQLAELRLGLLEGRVAVLDARLDIYSVNFGEASRNLESARAAVRAAAVQLGALGRQDAAKQLEPALTRIDEAQRMAGLLNQDANALAADAAKTIGDVLGSVVQP